jgi:hypothetical protein
MAIGTRVLRVCLTIIKSTSLHEIGRMSWSLHAWSGLPNSANAFPDAVNGQNPM